MEKVLKPAEGAQKTADESAEQNSEKQQKPCDIVGKTEFRRADNGLKSPYGARACGSGAGIAIQPRHTDSFCAAHINCTLKEIGEIYVAD